MEHEHCRNPRASYASVLGALSAVLVMSGSVEGQQRSVEEVLRYINETVSEHSAVGDVNLSIRNDTVFVWQMPHYDRVTEINLGDVWDVRSRIDAPFPGTDEIVEEWLIGLACEEGIRCARVLTEDGELTDRRFNMAVLLWIPSPRVRRSLTAAMAELLDLVERRR